MIRLRTSPADGSAEASSSSTRLLPVQVTGTTPDLDVLWAHPFQATRFTTPYRDVVDPASSAIVHPFSISDESESAGLGGHLQLQAQYVRSVANWRSWGDNGRCYASQEWFEAQIAARKNASDQVESAVLRWAGMGSKKIAQDFRDSSLSGAALDLTSGWAAAPATTEPFFVWRSEGGEAEESVIRRWFFRQLQRSGLLEPLDEQNRSPKLVQAVAAAPVHGWDPLLFDIPLATSWTAAAMGMFFPAKQEFRYLETSHMSAYYAVGCVISVPPGVKSILVAAYNTSEPEFEVLFPPGLRLRLTNCSLQRYESTCLRMCLGTKTFADQVLRLDFTMELPDRA